MESFNQTILTSLEIFKDRPWVQAGIIAVSALFIAYTLTAVLKNIAVRISKNTKFEIDIQKTAFIRPPLFYSILMLGLSISINLIPVADEIKTTSYAAFKTVGVIIWMVFVIRFSKIMLTASANNTSKIKMVHQQSLPLFTNLAFVLIIAFATYMIFQTWGIDMTAWLASAGVLGIAIGFASKDTLSNLISGVFILADAPYKIGDYVVLDSLERGAITEIGIRSTRMLTRDDVELTIPNAIMGNSKIVNQSGGPYQKFRIAIPVGVAYGSDIEQVKALLMQVANDNSLVCDFPAARVRFRLLGPSSLDFDLLVWAEKPELRGSVIDQLLTGVYNILKQHGVEIPYAKQDLYIKSLPHSTASQLV